MGKIFPNVTMIVIDRDQTLTHLYHAPELGVELPESFDMRKYKNLTRSQKIQYGKSVNNKIIEKLMFR